MTSRLLQAAGLLLGLAVGPAALAGDDAPEAVANAKARAAAARKVYESLMARRRGDPGFHFDPDQGYQWSRRWMEAEGEASGTKDGRVAAVEAHLERMKKWEKGVEADRRVGGVFSPGDLAAAEFYRLEAEAWLAKEKARKGGRP
jgi:hypothetical protein